MKCQTHIAGHGQHSDLGIDVSEDLKLIADEANNREFDNKSQN